MAQSMSGRVQVSEQQQTKLQQSVLNSRNVARVNASSINFRVNTGVVVPRTISVVSVAAYPALIDIYPDYRDDSFFVVDDEIVVLDRSRRIVDVVPAGPRARYARGGGVGRGGGSVAALDLSPDEIRIVQRVLIERGLLSGEADGVLGSDTQAALITFQRQEGFRATGSIDSATVSALGVSSRISATRNESTTVGQGGGQRPSARQDTTGQAPAQQNEPATSGRAGAEPGGQTTGQGAQRPSGQTTGQAPTQGTPEPLANQRSGKSDRDNAPASSPAQAPSNR
jgi:peptidoglycan hydrolase-like protein with peptidoglycan-binding domain